MEKRFQESVFRRPVESYSFPQSCLCAHSSPEKRRSEWSWWWSWSEWSWWWSWSEWSWWWWSWWWGLCIHVVCNMNLYWKFFSSKNHPKNGQIHASGFTIIEWLKRDEVGWISNCSIEKYCNLLELQANCNILLFKQIIYFLPSAPHRRSSQSSHLTSGSVV